MCFVPQITHVTEQFIGQPQVVVQGQDCHPLEAHHDNLNRKETENHLRITLKQAGEKKVPQGSVLGPLILL